MKKLIAMGLTVILTAATLCGCGSTGSTTNDSKESSSDKQAAVKLIDLDLTEEQYAFGVDKDQPELLAAANDFIKEIKENGQFDEICNK